MYETLKGDGASNGPEFLQKTKKLWPQEVTKPVTDKNLERRQLKIVCEMEKEDEVIDSKMLSRWRRLARVTARLQRLASKIRLGRVNQ